MDAGMQIQHGVGKIPGLRSYNAFHGMISRGCISSPAVPPVLWRTAARSGSRNKMRPPPRRFPRVESDRRTAPAETTCTAATPPDRRRGTPGSNPHPRSFEPKPSAAWQNTPGHHPFLLQPRHERLQRLILTQQRIVGHILAHAGSFTRPTSAAAAMSANSGHAATGQSVAIRPKSPAGLLSAGVP